MKAVISRKSTNLFLTKQAAAKDEVSVREVGKCFQQNLTSNILVILVRVELIKLQYSKVGL